VPRNLLTCIKIKLDVTDILKKNNKDVAKVPLVWYTGTAELRELTAKEKAVNKLSPTQYQTAWMTAYNAILKNNKA
jgi:hypothetical protein